MINLICVGNLKEDYFKNAEEEYIKRLSKYTSLNIVEIKEEKQDDKTSLIKEKERIENKLKPSDYIVILDIKGKELTSKELAKTLENTLATYNKDISFIIGSSHGLHQDIKDKANLKLSFSRLTFPHQLFRIIFLEQLYRSYKIINNEPYHK